jgi:hypothetical protein
MLRQKGTGALNLDAYRGCIEIGEHTGDADGQYCAQ